MNLDLDKVPTTLDEAVEMLYASLEEEDKNFIKNESPDSIHHGAGRWLRNNWSLWQRETPLVQWFIKNLGIGHADDLSGTIHAALWAKVKGEKFDAIAHVEHYKKHWINFGVHPVTQEKLV